MRYSVRFTDSQISFPDCPRGPTISWLGCYGLCHRHRHEPTKLAHSLFYSALVSVSVFMALSTVFHSINSPDNSSLSHSVLLTLLCLICPFNSISLYESLPQPWVNPLWLTGLKAPSNSRFLILCKRSMQKAQELLSVCQRTVSYKEKKENTTLEFWNENSCFLVLKDKSSR